MKLAILTIRGKPVNPGISALVFLLFSLVVGVIPFAYHDTAAANFPDEDTLLSFFGEDACQLTSTTVEERNSYACSAFLLESAGLSAETAPLAGAILSVALTMIPLFQFRRVSLGVFLVSVGWGFIRAIFLSVLSKDMLSATVVLICVMAARSSYFGWIWLATATLYGWMVRKYWLLVSAVWVGLWMVRKRLTVFRLVMLILLIYIAMALVFQVALGVSLDFARAQVNENREIGAEGSRTIIEAVIASENPIAQALNALITYFRLAFPLELLRFGSVGQLAFIAIMPFTYIWMIRVIVKGVKSKDPKMIQAGKIALAPLSFLIIEGIFEPDFGSFARHFAMVSPLVFSAMALVQQAERAQNRRLLRARMQAQALATTPTPTPEGA
ncbi:hypothetical protein M2165_004670 [Variovorax sp. TBS-050B]|uniref:hypothetical protein n=1 Tax=Variovorax sp. TBS-050B TaxID=2940551 RepID=UPI002474A7BC|nr:hypothetical protein [Variovorax sp. TBS-050B]MDH6594781.1 hypothetical protein [Variovorax sp. TBS-050B]